MGLIGIPLGALAALNHNAWVDRAIVVTALGLQAIPIYVIAPFLLIFLALGLNVTGVFGWDGTIFSRKAILPIVVLTLTGLTGVLRLTRVLVLDVLSEDYIRTARAKGIPERVVLLRHILRPVLVPVITSLGLIMVGIVNGAIIVERVFGVPGLGKKTIDFTTGIYGVDYPVLATITLIGALAAMASNLLVDITYPILDPRARGAMVGEEE
jgi:ABC-type dipeptide/oligopeptide/nickel transport system permease component